MNLTNDPNDGLSPLEEVAIALQINRPVHIWGVPGTGKTSAVETLAKRLGMEVEVFIGSIHDPVDLAGAIRPLEDRFVYLPPNWVFARAQAGKDFVLFLDEFNCTRPDMQAAMHRIILERKVGEYPLPAGTRIVMASNPPGTGTLDIPLSPAVANRSLHVIWKPDYEEVAAGIERGDFSFLNESILILPENWRETHLPMARQFIAAFLRQFPRCLYETPVSGNETFTGPYPTPRSWEYLAVPWFAACMAIGLPLEKAAYSIWHAVGEGVGAQFSRFVMEGGISPTELLERPVKLPPFLVRDALHRLVSHLGNKVELYEDDCRKFWRVITENLEYRDVVFLEVLKRVRKEVPGLIAFIPDAILNELSAVATSREVQQ
jgi:hypothetical protein